MGISVSKPVIWLLLYRKVKPSDIIRLGFARATVYAYAARYAGVKRQLKELLTKLEMLAKVGGVISGKG